MEEEKVDGGAMDCIFVAVVISFFLFCLFVWMAEDQKFGCPLLRRNFGCICADAEEYIIIIYFLNGPGASRRKGKRWWYL
jgi:hypothetical protein